MPLDLESLSEAQKVALMASIAHALTIAARDGYAVGTNDVADPQTLRAFNELQHRVTGSLAAQLSGSSGFFYSLQSIVEMVQHFGVRHNRIRESEWILKQAFEAIKNNGMGSEKNR